MAHDGSLASLTEDWIVTQIRAITINAQAVFEDVEVVPWPGTLAKNSMDAAKELLSGSRDAIVRVRFRRDTCEPLEAGEQRLRAMYDIFVGVRNERNMGEARRGDGTKLGTNRMRDLFYTALHNKRPALIAGGRVTDRSWWMGSEEVLNEKNAAIQLSVLRVDEVPSAA